MPQTGNSTTYSVSANGSPITSYEWAVDGGGTIVGDNFNSTVVINWTTAGTWRVTCTIVNCMSTETGIQDVVVAADCNPDAWEFFGNPYCVGGSRARMRRNECGTEMEFIIQTNAPFCETCAAYTYTGPGGGTSNRGTLTYSQCNGGSQTVLEVAGDTTNNFCAVVDSIYVTNGITYTQLGLC